MVAIVAQLTVAAMMVQLMARHQHVPRCMAAGEARGEVEVVMVLSSSPCIMAMVAMAACISSSMKIL